MPRFIRPNFIALVGFFWLLVNNVQAQYWQANYKFNQSYMGCVEFMDKDTGFAAGPKMYRTTDAGKTWSLQNASNSNFSKVHFANAQVGYVCGENNQVLKTSNGGVSWQSIPTAHNDDDFYTICTVDADTIYFIAMDDLQTYKYAKYIHYSYDGGSNWQRKSTGSTQTMRCMHMWNGKTGIIGQLTAGVIRTTDGWNSYSTINAGLQITDLDVIKDSVVVLVGNNGKIARSSDYGKTFKAITSPTSNHLTSVHFANDSFGMAGGYNGTILQTTDGGRTWIKMSSTTGNQVNDVLAINPFYAWFVVHSVKDSFDIYKFGSENYAASDINIIQGNVSADINGNCQWDNGEGGPSGILVRADPGGYMTYTRQNGAFELVVTDTGTFSLSTRLPEKYQVGDGLCDSVISNIRFTSLDQRSAGNRFLFESDTTVNLEVTVVSPRQRRCGNNSIQIRYKNLGFRPVDSVDLKLSYPDELIGIQSTSHTYSGGNGTLIFKLGKLNPGQEGKIALMDTVFCEEFARNSSVCLKVLITPRVQVLNEEWDSSWIHSKLNCYDSLVILKVYNDGETMKDSGDLDLFLGEEYQDRQRYLLHKGDSLRWQIDRDGEEAVVFGDVRKHHPWQEEFRVWKERCKTDSVLLVNKITNYRMVKLRSFEDEICVRIRDSYDPNDIRVFPSGLTDEHWIPNNQELRYVVRFQNTGNDTAYVVRVVDTLPVHLDPFSLQVLGSSHTMKSSMQVVRGKTVLTAVFEDINLVDSATNPPMSEGWFSFRIQPEKHFSHRTVIPNLVDIYFDFNPPIRTNTAWVQIFDSALIPSGKVRPVECGTRFTSKLPDTIVCDRLDLTLNIPTAGLNNPKIYTLTSGLSVQPFGSNNFRLTASGKGRYFYVATVQDCDVERRDTGSVYFTNSPKAELADTTLCFSADYWIDLTCDDCEFLWNNGSDSSSIRVAKQGKLKVVTSNVCASVEDSMEVRILPALNLFVGRDTVVCNASQLELKSNLGPLTQWWSGRFTERITVTGDGKYQARYTDQCNALKDTVWVRFRKDPLIELGPDTLYCERLEHGIQLPLLDFEHSVVWNDRNTSFNRFFTEPGTYSIQSVNLCGTETDSVTLFLDFKPQLTLPADTGFCGQFTYTLRQPQIKNGQLFRWIDNGAGGDRTVSNPGAYSAILENGCGQDTASIILTRYPVPQSAFSISGVCDTGIVSFGNLSTISDNSSLSYRWDMNGELTSTQKNPSIDFSSNGYKRIVLRTSSRAGCSDSSVQNIPVGWFTKADFAWSDPLCEGREVHFVNRSFTTAPSATYSWIFGDGNQSVLQHPVHTFPISEGEKRYSVSLISTPVEGCSDTIVQEIVVKELPEPKLHDSVYRNTLFLSLSGLLPSDRIEWQLNNLFYGNEAQLVHRMEAEEIGRFCAIVTTDASCMDTVCLPYNNAWSFGEGLHFFPNPANEYVECWFGSEIKGDLKIFDMTGRVVLARSVQSDQEILDLRHLVIGTYLLEWTETGKDPVRNQLLIQ